MKATACVAAALLSASAYSLPNIPNLMAEQDLEKRAAGQAISKAETNCGPNGPCLGFDPKAQFVSTSGAHAFKSPGKGDIRGPCPGLNAAANHAYLPRNGIPNIQQTITGLSQSFGMGVGLAGFLAAYAVVLDGNIETQTWSIGGPPPYKDILGGVLTPPQGISYSHNNYEGDTSIGRNDAYLNHGDAYSLNVTRFGYAYALGQTDGSDRLTLDKFRRDVVNNQERSIQNNPYYFTGLFSTTLVAPAAYNFVINLMSNHSASEPNGYLDGSQFKTFFGVTGTYNPKAESSGYGFTWLPGQERIPENWYRRPLANAYENIDVVEDLAIGWAAYPDSFRFGGNTNGVNTYEGVDVATLTGGTYQASDIPNSKNFACLVYQFQQQALANQLQGTVNKLTAALDLLGQYSSFYKDLSCPKLAKFNEGAFGKFPGYKYKEPKAPSNGGGILNADVSLSV